MADLKLLFDHLVRFEIQLWDAVDARVRAECDLQLTRFEVMRLLDDRGPCRVQDIATEYGITTGGASKVVDRIESAGHCRRSPNPTNRRSSLVELTADGRRVLRRARKVFENELEQRIGAVLAEPEIDRLTLALGELRGAMRAKPPS